MRVVVDTNGWISRFISSRSRLAQHLLDLIANPATAVLFSPALREEVLTVLRRPKFAKYVPLAKLRLYELKIQTFELTPVSSTVAACRDPKDNFLLALCLDGRADFLITGDQDLLVLKQFQQTRIISWAEAEAGPGLLTT